MTPMYIYRLDCQATEKFLGIFHARDQVDAYNQYLRGLTRDAEGEPVKGISRTVRMKQAQAEGLEENIKVRKLGVLTEAEQRLCSYEEREKRSPMEKAA